MATPTKPILYNSFKVRDDLTVKSRIERIFFTEVYLLSNGKYLYLFTNLKPEETVDRAKNYDLIKLDVDGKKYLGVITDEHANEKISDIVDDLTVLRGFDCVAGMKPLKSLLINEVIELLFCHLFEVNTLSLGPAAASFLSLFQRLVPPFLPRFFA